ncbi:hypothetical protein CCR97_03605 [Rhodoplanes elegans]|uniref:Uncharacterized protein n=1 Tax=Rhodoplanes elegans TaxID=29408 RepID=A0A327KIB0_9BRAD|nr:hypothetical protein [Rhodoplanes elegans]MBK5957294.1 hypothetical protein [Rhodoplanes elegans]RAI37886.1 hypothetical protein CH338_14565 [Rhodoplanes elegans]
MALEIDGFEVFRSIGSHRAAFEAIAPDVVKAARTLVVKLIKDKKTELAAVRAIHSALGAEAFGLVTDGMSDAEIKSLGSKLDKHNPVFKETDPAAQRRLVLALAGGMAEPAEKSKAAPKAPKVTKSKKVADPKSLERISFSSAGATRKR